MKLARLLLLIALGAIGVMLVAPPAAWLGALLPAPFHFKYASGTLWKGQVLIASREPLCPVAWQFAGFAEGAVRFNVSASAPCTGRAVLVMKQDSVMVQDLALDLDAAFLAKFIPGFETWRPAGRLGLHSPAFALWPVTQGEGTLNWQGARLAKLPIEKLGDYEANFKLQGTGLSAQVHTLTGPLMLEGEAGFAGSPNVNLIASSQDPKLERWLRTLGIMEGPGRYRLAVRM